MTAPEVEIYSTWKDSINKTAGVASSATSLSPGWLYCCFPTDDTLTPGQRKMMYKLIILTPAARFLI